MERSILSPRYPSQSTDVLLEQSGRPMSMELANGNEGLLRLITYLAQERFSVRIGLDPLPGAW
jgi:hypothetical protein